MPCHTDRAVTTSDLISLGFAAAIGQAVLLREAMAALGGSELAWGLVLGAWLTGMGFGAWASVRGRVRGATGPALVLGLVLAGVVVLRAAPALARRAPGEVLSFAHQVWIWLAAVVPPAVAGGWAFGRLALGAGGSLGAGAAYAWESLGAVVGGVAFTFLLAPVGSAASTLVAAALVVLAGLACRGRVWIGLALAAPLLASGPPAESWLAGAGWRWAERPGELAVARDTRQQRIELAGGVPAALYADGSLLAELPDPYRAAPRAHLLALLHPAPRRVLLVGAVPGELEPYLLRHPVDRLEVVVEDPGLPALLREVGLEPGSARERTERLDLEVGEPLRVVRRGGPWDLVILADADPTTLRQHRTRSREFVAACRAALAPDGVLAMRVGVGDTYLGGGGGRLLATLYATLCEELPVVRAIPGEEVWLVGARAELDLSPVNLAERWRERGLTDPVFRPELLPALLDPGRTAALQGFLQSAPARPTTAAHPLAVLEATALAEGRAEGCIGRALAGAGKAASWALPAAISVWACWLVLGGLRRRVSRPGLLAAVGLCSIGWWLLLLGAWQATRGSVYAEVGVLNAVLMTGLAAAARWSGRDDRASERRLALVFVGGAVVSAAVTAWWVWGGGGRGVPPLLLLAGIVTGAAFPGVAALPGPRKEALGAPRGFAADELGAAVGAVVLGLLGLPVLGAATLGLSLAGLCLGAAASAALASRR